MDDTVSCHVGDWSATAQDIECTGDWSNNDVSDACVHCSARSLLSLTSVLSMFCRCYLTGDVTIGIIWFSDGDASSCNRREAGIRSRHRARPDRVGWRVERREHVATGRRRAERDGGAPAILRAVIIARSFVSFQFLSTCCLRRVAAASVYTQSLFRYVQDADWSTVSVSLA